MRVSAKEVEQELGKQLHRTPSDLERLTIAGWRISVDCGPCVQLVQDTYEPTDSTETFYPSDLGGPFEHVRYVSKHHFDATATALLRLAVASALDETRQRRPVPCIQIDPGERITE